MKIARRVRRTCSVVVVAVAMATVCTAGAPVEGPDPNIVTAIFVDASPLLPGFTVRTYGVQVGEVQSISVQHGQAWVRMRIDEAAALPLHRDATAKIRPVSLLGERYIDFSRGTPTAPVAPVGEPIPVERTASAVDLQNVLNAVDQPTGAALAALVTTLGDGERGRARDIDAALATLAPSLQRTDSVVTLLNQQNDVLAGLIDRAAPVTREMASDHGQDLDRLLESSELLLRTTSENQQALDTAIKRLPQTLSDARRTLAELAGVSEQGTATLKGLRPFTDALPKITGELQDFSDAADPALASLEPVLRHGQDLVDEATPLARTLRPAGSDLKSVSRSVRPIVKELTSNLGDVLTFFRNWSMTCSAYDGISNYFRGLAVIQETQGTGLLPSSIASKVPAVPGPIDGKEPIAPPVPMLLDNRTPPTDPGNATGLRPVQERHMLNQLMGGG